MSSFKTEILVASDAHHAWEYYFNQINGWWPKAFFTSEKTKRFIIETKVGGKVFEDFGEGFGLEWGRVIGVDYPNSLQIKGHLTREFGGPSITFEKFEFNDQNNGCVVSYQLDMIGKNDSKTIDSLKKGWDEILKVHFANYCKSKS